MAKDSLARGARSAQFGGPSGVSQAKWDKIWAPDEETTPTSDTPTQIGQPLVEEQTDEK